MLAQATIVAKPTPLAQLRYPTQQRKTLQRLIHSKTVTALQYALGMLCPFSYWDIIGHSSQLAVTLLYLDTIVHSLVDCHSNMAIEHLVEFTVFSILVLRSLMHNSKN